MSDLYAYIDSRHDHLCRCEKCRIQIVGGEHDGQELRELPEEWDAGGGFAALLDEASDAQLVAFADMVREAIQHRVTHYQRHERDTRARVLFEVAIKRFGHTLRW